MKKLLIAFCMMLSFAGIATAQSAAPATKTTSTTATKPGKVVKMNKSSNKVAASGLKADGTPDMRLKENKVKAVAPVTGPTKKDGSADMRYKSNKAKKTPNK